MLGSILFHALKFERFDGFNYNLDRNYTRITKFYATIGILVTRPDLPTGKEILNSLEYFHFRTGKTINFICQGTGHTDQGQNIPIEKKLLKLMGLNGSSVTRSLHNILKIWKNIQNGSILEKVSFY